MIIRVTSSYHVSSQIAKTGLSKDLHRIPGNISCIIEIVSMSLLEPKWKVMIVSST